MHMSPHRIARQQRELLGHIGVIAARSSLQAAREWREASAGSSSTIFSRIRRPKIALGLQRLGAVGPDFAISADETARATGFGRRKRTCAPPCRTSRDGLLPGSWPRSPNMRPPIAAASKRRFDQFRSNASPSHLRKRDEFQAVARSGMASGRAPATR